MKLPIKLIVVSTLFVGFISFNLLAKVNTGDQAPDFTLINLNTNESVSLSDFKGKVVYLDFWASWCKPCIQSFPALNGLHEKYEARGFEMLAVNLDMRKKLATDFLSKYKVSYKNLYDAGMKVGRKYDVSVMPVGYMIDKTGKVRGVHHGFNRGDEKNIEKAIKILLEQ